MTIKEKKDIEIKKEGMELSSEGVFALTTMDDQKKYADFLITQKLVSETFKTPSQLIIAIQLCKDLNLPMSCLKDFYVIGGKPAIYGDTFVGLALGSGLVQDHKVEFFDENGEKIRVPKKGQKPFSCLVSIKRKGSSEFVEAFYSWDDKESSRNNNPNFIKHPIDMLFRRAMGRAIKFALADAVRGIELIDYAEEANRSPDEQEKTKQMLETFSK